MDPTRTYLQLTCEECSDGYLQQERVYRRARWPNRCPKCRHQTYKCRQCGAATTRGYDLCKSCSHLKPRAECAGCGRRVRSSSAVRCLPCHNKKQNRGLSRERTLFNVSPNWAKARTACFQRDNYTCQECGKRGGVLHAHHMKSYRDHPELRLSVSNLLTLCEPCHRATHGLTPKL